MAPTKRRKDVSRHLFSEGKKGNNEATSVDELVLGLGEMSMSPGELDWIGDLERRQRLLNPGERNVPLTSTPTCESGNIDGNLAAPLLPRKGAVPLGDGRYYTSNSATIEVDRKGKEKVLTLGLPLVCEVFPDVREEYLHRIAKKRDPWKHSSLF